MEAGLIKDLLCWYARHGRTLPWRTHPNPYGIVVSEFMLQQTRVETVIPYYEAWMKRWPDLSRLAASREDEVLAAWKGLGYYHRALRLRLFAVSVCERHGGVIPGDPEVLIQLPGIGPYTSAAIASIAYGRPALPLDGNLRRVLSRVFADEQPSPSAEQDRFIADAFLPELRRVRKRSEAVQALMDLGAGPCRPRSPDCESCPLRRSCRAHLEGKTQDIPRRHKSPVPEELHIFYTWLICGKQVALRKRPEKGRFPGMWEPPSLESAMLLPLHHCVCPITHKKGKALSPFRSDFTRYRVTWHPFVLSVADKSSLPEGFDWVSFEDLCRRNLIPAIADRLAAQLPV
ncbi:MAG: A/G-specific adenine glycosylase [Planctomycetes bacterium]|nr:A/G-specific adenine glycosylase [Planctomycetota bacterium]